MKQSRNGLYRRGRVLAFRYRDQDCVWKEKYTGTRDRAEARKFKEEFLRKVSTGTLPTEKSKWTVELAAVNWIRQHAANLKSAKARRNEESLVRQLTKRLGTIKLKSITLDHLKDYQLARSKEVGERAYFVIAFSKANFSCGTHPSLAGPSCPTRRR